MNCKKANKNLSQYIDGDLSPRQASEIQSHILSCRSCAEALDKLTKAVNVLESLPQEENGIDLYPAFQRRLAVQRGGIDLHIPALMPRRWAAAGIVVVLLLCGSLIGSALKGNRTLYVSNPRPEYSSIYSSVAIAAEQTQNRPGVDSTLLADSRLSDHISIRAKGETLERVLGTLSKNSKVKISISPDLAIQKIYLRFDDAPISTVMSEIRKLSDSDWVVTENPSGRTYELVCSGQVKKMAAAVAEAQAMRQAEDILRKIKQAIDEKNPELIEQYSIGSFQGLAAQIQKLRENPGHEISAEASGLFLIDDEAISTLMTGREYAKPYSEMSDEQKKLFRSWTRYDYKKGNCELIIRLPRKEDGSIDLSIGVKYDGGSFDTGTTLVSPFWGYRGTNLLNLENLTELYEEAKSGSRAYDDPRLQVKLGNGVYGDVPAWKNKPTYTLAEMLDLIADKTNLTVVADYFTVDANNNRMIPKELTLGELLALLEHDYNIAWNLSPDNTLRLVHRQWPVLQDTEPSQTLVDRMNSAIKKTGRLGLKELGELAALSPRQFEGTLVAIKDSDVSSHVRNIMSNLKQSLLIYANLSPAQRRMVESKKGLPGSEMTAEQKHQAVLAAHFLLYGCTDNYKPEDLKKDITFSVISIRTTGRQIQKITGHEIFNADGGVCSGNGIKPVIFDPIKPDEPRDYVILKFAHNCEPNEGRCFFDSHKACYGIFDWK